MCVCVNACEYGRMCAGHLLYCSLNETLSETVLIDSSIFSHLYTLLILPVKCIVVSSSIISKGLHFLDFFLRI